MSDYGLDYKPCRRGGGAPTHDGATDGALPHTAGRAARPKSRKTLTGGALFLGLYTVFMFGCSLSAPGYIARVWNPSLSGVLTFDIPLEEFLFGVAFGLHWSAIYEHYTWTEGVVHAGQGHRSPTRAKVSDRRI